MIKDLIDAPDIREVVRDQIAGILKAEVDSQITLAIAAGKPSTDKWDLRVFTERRQPWDGFGVDKWDRDERPVVNVSLESATPSRSASSALRKSYEGRYYIDCWAYAVTTSTGSGHDPSDYLAALRAGEVTTLIRNIIMADEYVSLGLGGTVVQARRVTRITPSDLEDPTAVNSISMVRIELEVTFEEVCIETEGVALRTLTVSTEVSPQGEVIESEYNYNT